MHINAVGASVPPYRELDADAIAKSRLYVDARAAAALEAEDILAAEREGGIPGGHIIGEVGEVLEGRVKGRTDVHDITLFKSVGLAIEDVAAARHVYDRALAEGVGTDLSLGGARRDGA
jgi:ornithine cyclodeaminase